MHIRLRWVLAFLGALGILALAGVLLLPRFMPERRALPSTTVTTVYTICGHEKEGGKVSASVANFLYDRDAGTKFGDWRVLQRDEKMLRLAYETDQLCPDCRHRRFLGIADGFVAVYTGTPVHRGETVEVTRIPVAALPQGELSDLQHRHRRRER